MTAHRLLPLLALSVLPIYSGSADAPSAVSPAFPLDNVRVEAELLARLMSGGRWLNGLPGRPRYNGTHIHAGVDLKAAQGDLVYAVLDGVVDPMSDTVHSGYGPGWTPGRVLIVRSYLPDGTAFLLLYGHTQNHRVKGGEAVVRGQPIAEIGPWLAAEGGPHLHLTMRLGDMPRYGWGTPTLAGQQAREGAETVADEDDVLRLGYRDPLRELWGLGMGVVINLP